MTWSNTATTVLQADTVIVTAGSGNSTGVFVYSGTPAAGNLIMSVAAGDGTDAFGNAYGPGIISYPAAAHAGAVGLYHGQIFFGNAPDFVNAASIWSALFFGGSLAMTTGTGDANHVDAALALMYAGTDSTATGQATTPYLQLKDADTSSAMDLRLSGSVIATDLAGNDETWHTPTYVNGWAGGPFSGTVQPLQYRRDGEDNLVIVGAAHGGTATTMFTLPAGWRPAITQRSPGVNNAGGTASPVFCEVNSNGNVSISTVNGDTYFQVCVPLGHLP